LSDLFLQTYLEEKNLETAWCNFLETIPTLLNDDH
jgi:hypothetical protein